MRYYETLYLINPDLADEDYKGIVEKFNNLIEKNKGELIKVDEWGKKTLAYNIKKFDKGYYVLLKYCGEPGIIEDLKRDLKLDDSILKHQTIKLGDNVDPKALKSEAEKSETKVDDEEKATEEPEPEKENENGI
ncbi:MAG: 30S ribosomal protein S6 [Desulfobacterales bacterium]|nr:30S ribosomal protein S6 [Desulfobacterales bacterium]